MFCMCFYMLNRFGTAYIIFHYVQERERTLKEFGALTNMGYLQCGIMLLCNETGFMGKMKIWYSFIWNIGTINFVSRLEFFFVCFMNIIADRMTFLMKCTRKAPQDELHVEVWYWYISMNRIRSKLFEFSSHKHAIRLRIISNYIHFFKYYLMDQNEINWIPLKTICFICLK